MICISCRGRIGEEERFTSVMTDELGFNHILNSTVYYHESCPMTRMESTMTDPTAPKAANIAEVFKFFSQDDPDYKLGAFRNDWKELTPTDKVQIQTGIGNGTLTY